MKLGLPPNVQRSGQSQREKARLAGVLLTLTLAMTLIQGLRPALVVQFRRSKTKHDTYALPSPGWVVPMCLGYRAAFADFLMAHVLVQSGIHLSEKRRFDAAASYLQTINELEPKFATPYRFADTILTLQASSATLDDYQSARSILERGMRELPYDMELWLSAGQFMAYVAPYHVGQLAGEAVAAEWKQEGIRRMARSCELIGKDENAPHRCAVAASLMSRSGEVEALRQFVERLVSVSDDPEVHGQALRSLSRAVGESEKLRIESRRKRYDRLRSRGLSFVGKDRFLLVGPAFEPFSCLSIENASNSGCATSMAEFHHREDILDGLGS